MRSDERRGVEESREELRVSCVQPQHGPEGGDEGEDHMLVDLEGVCECEVLDAWALLEEGWGGVWGLR